MKYFVLGSIVLAASVIIGCDSSGGVCCNGEADAEDNQIDSPIQRVQNDDNMTISYNRSLTSYDWNVTTTGNFPDDANCTFISSAPIVVIPKICFDYDPSNSVSIVLKGTDEDNQTVDENQTVVWQTPSGSGGEGGSGSYE